MAAMQCEGEFCASVLLPLGSPRAVSAYRGHRDPAAEWSKVPPLECAGSDSSRGGPRSE